MVTDRFNIKYRIFKRERVREGNNSLVIVPKNKKIINKNQVEFAWTNKGLEEEHLSILGRVMVKEWERLLPETIISRAFVQVKKDNEVRIYISFEVENDLTSEEIKKIISTGMAILNECLEKVTIKVVGEEKFAELFTSNESNSQNEMEVKSEETELVEVDSDEEDELIRKLHSEIAIQEELLQQLTEQQNKQEAIQATEEKMKETYEEIKKSNESDERIEQLMKQNASLEQQHESLINQLASKDKLSKELEHKVAHLEEELKNKPLNDNRAQKIDRLEKKNQELKKENSDYRIQCMESQSLIDQYNNKNSHLKTSLEQLEQSKNELLKEAQEENKNLDESLKEAHKQLILETNNRQKNEINLEDVRKKLVEATLESQKKDKQIKSLLVDLQNEKDNHQDTKAEIETLNDEIDNAELELKMIKTTNNVLKERLDNLEDQKEKWDLVDEWQEKYESLIETYLELEQEGNNYRQEVSLLNSQLIRIQGRLEAMPQAVSVPSMITTTQQAIDLIESPFKRDSNSAKSVANNQDTSLKTSNNIDFFEALVDEDDDYFYYEEDPYLTDVMTKELMNVHREDKIKDERIIRDMLSAYEENSNHDVKIDRAEYRQRILDFKFLSFRWSQVLIMDDADKNTEFLNWCAPYIKRIEEFEEELSLDVKKSFFMKNYVTMDESVYKVLIGYSKLSVYLDTYYLKLSFYIDKYFLNGGKQ